MDEFILEIGGILLLYQNIFHSYGNVNYRAIEFYVYTAFEKGGVFIVPHLLGQETSAHLVASYDTH
jgi:hypothetical protein